MSAHDASDEATIRAIVADMFESISWSPGGPPDFAAFSRPIRAEAVLVPAARPAAPVGIDTFVDRMTSLHAGGSIATFDERADKTIVKVFGNVAVAIGSYSAEMDGKRSRGVNGFLFIKDGEEWQVAGLAWDGERDDQPIPAELA